MKIYDTRLFSLSLLVGLFAGVFGSAFRWLLGKTALIREFMFQHDKSILFHIGILAGMWILMLGINWLKNHIALISGSGIPQSKGIIFGRFSFRKPWLQFIGKFTGSVSAIGMGLSLGREGPSVEIGSLGAAIISRYFKTSPIERRYLSAAGAGAGLSAAFTAPIASAIFVIEDMLGWVSLRVGLPALLACIVAGFCARMVFTENVYLEVPTVFPEVDHGTLFLILTGFAVLGALGGKLFNLTLFGVKKGYDTLRIPVWLKLLIVAGFTYIAGMLVIDLTSGGETELINQALSENGNVWWLFAMTLIKIAFTAISYSTGLCGSLLLPLIVLGGLLGKGYALLLIQLGITGADTTGFFTIIGMSIFFISVVRAPISGLMLTLEMTGQYHVFYPMIITGTLTFLFGQYIGVIPVYHHLYEQILKEEKNQYDEWIETDFEINYNSAMIGKSINDILLPDQSKIIRIMRYTPQPVTLGQSDLLQRGDIIRLKIKESDYEKLFRVFRSLTDE